MATKKNRRHDDDDGKDQVYVWQGYIGTITPRSFDVFSSLPVQKVALGSHHISFLTKFGEMYTYGNNQYGQLGLGHLTDELKEPFLVEALLGKFITNMDCGMRHTAAVTSSGDVYCWGDALHGQCGPYTTDKIPTPCLVSVTQDHHVCQHGIPAESNAVSIQDISCGDTHTLALSTDSDIYVWGTGPQLGLGQVKHTSKPTLMQTFTFRHVLSISAGAQHSVALVKKKTVSTRNLSTPESPQCKIKVHDIKPSTCVECNNEIYTYTETNDTCIIDNDHTCPLGLDIDKTVASEDSGLEHSNGSEANSVYDSNGANSEPKPTQAHLLVVDDTVPKSKSSTSFVDEIEAKAFLQRQLSNNESNPGANLQEKTSEIEIISRTSSLDNVDHIVMGGQTFPPSNNAYLRGKIGSILNNVPMTSGVVDQVSTITSKVMSTVKDSMDKFGFVSSPNIDSITQISESSSVESFSSDSRSDSLSGSSPTLQRHRHVDPKRSKSLKPDDVIEEDKLLSRTKSLPVGLVNHVKQDGEVCCETEVWVWGDGQNGQLGLADLKERHLPCCIKSLNDKNIVKISAGSYHSLALAATSQVYSWGRNEDGQLGHNEPLIETPHRVRFVGSNQVWDIAASERHSVFLVDGISCQPDLYYCGREPRQSICEDEQQHSTSSPSKLSSLKQVGFVKAIICGGDLCGCISDKNTTGHIATLHEFASTERSFYCQLFPVLNRVVLPFTKTDIYDSLLKSSHGATIKSLFETFISISNMVCSNSLELTAIIQQGLPIETLRCIDKHDFYMNKFKTYSKYFGDMLALGGFEQIAKEGQLYFESIQSVFSEMLEESKLDKENPSVNVRRLMQIPLRRLKDYGRLKAKLALAYVEGSEEHCHLTSLSKMWDGIKSQASVEHTVAESTRVFWESSPYKLVESLKVSNRRLLKESKSLPLTIPQAGRFSTHWFILFNDVFVHAQFSTNQAFPLSTVWIEPLTDTETTHNVFTLTTPEEFLTLSTPGPTEKAEWTWEINRSIDKVLADKKQIYRPKGGSHVSPPLSRHATYKFYKAGKLKDAVYTGMWLSGKMHGQGELVWSDGRTYTGRFKNSLQHGHGQYQVQKADGVEVYEGNWRDGKMHGLGSIKYANGDVYEGYFKDGVRHGHGVFKQGRMTSSLASVFVGEWANDKRNGYGVLDDILKGEKFIGMWVDDNRHGNGVMVTLDGMYYEGNFATNKMSGTGLVMTEDNTCYEGDFSGGFQLYGKGKMTLPNGDTIEGHFSGSWSSGIKISGTFQKSVGPVNEKMTFNHALGILPKTFGTLSVSADRKWEEIFQHCRTVLGCQEGETTVDSQKAWEMVAIVISNGKKRLQDKHLLDSPKHLNKANLEALEKIPIHDRGTFSIADFQEIQAYLAKAFDTCLHPLGKLVEGIVDVYRATYVGVGAHPRLLHHAVLEVKSYINRIYSIIRLLFPDLPVEPTPVQLISSNKESIEETMSKSITSIDDLEADGDIISAAELLHPLLLPKIYPPLFTLYALYNEREDERYWERLQKWNKQGDISLLAYLGVHEKFWLVKTESNDITQVSSVKDQCYTVAIETLQHISTTFSPAEKLKVIHKTFDGVNRTVQDALGSDYLWSMDDLFPVFQYVVVRARIRHLGAEIHGIDDLMEPHLEHGELGIMFTTLKACYFQIQNEKINW
ncbi:unnamed protein product [Owenia fusiformis]|uniref:Uncharacterized protein n=1 Tax=Owenia fusiformis TaxID=6347 RepID=A0A8J1Y4W0_OWEFU|nr:unnamed protein product [Owenia fusiformis]